MQKSISQICIYDVANSVVTYQQSKHCKDPKLTPRQIYGDNFLLLRWNKMMLIWVYVVYVSISRNTRSSISTSCGSVLTLLLFCFFLTKMPCGDTSILCLSARGTTVLHSKLWTHLKTYLQHFRNNICAQHSFPAEFPVGLGVLPNSLLHLAVLGAKLLQSKPYSAE